MKLSAYIVAVDAGFAPNPFGRYCTLACCKPTIRRKAEKDDVIVGTASARSAKPGHLIYAMRVLDVLPYQTYWADQRFQSRKPTAATAISRRGDNIWYRESGRWRVLGGSLHDISHRNRDTGGVNAVVAREFYYFGCEAIPVDADFKSLLASTQGHKNCREPQTIQRFWDWVTSVAPRTGRIGNPFEFTDAGCRAQCDVIEDDDIEEC